MALYLVFALQWPGFTFPLLNFNNLLTLHSFANILPFTASTMYHLFMCHRYGAGIYHKLLSFDMIGVWAVNTFGYVIAIIATFRCFHILQFFTLAIYLSMSGIALYYLITAKNASQRFVPLSFYALSRPLILLARLYINYLQLHTEHLEVRFYVFMDTVAMLGAVINVFKFPERFLPGCLDFAINSHQIMHLCTMASILCLTKASELDIEFLSACHCWRAANLAKCKSLP